MLEKTQQEKAQQVLSELLRLLGTTAQVLCLEQDDDFRLSVQSEEAGRLIGRKGQTLESLELILNRILRCQHNNDESLPWVPVEVDGYSVTRRGNGDAGRSGGHEGGG
ncbi:MAG TPA: KH domain-containing protein, partial [Lentisphaeria bacterium]|nr:KH domain-containing protein [Lentisphaeria bacterium]